MNINTDKPIRVSAYGMVSQKKGYWHSGRSLAVHMLIYITSGRLDMKISDRLYRVSVGDILFIPKNTFYAPKEAEGLSYYFIHFEAESEAVLFDNFQMYSNNALPSGEYEYTYSGGDPVISISTLTKSAALSDVKSIFNRIASLNIWGNPAEKLLLDGLVRQLLVVISEGYLKPKNLSKLLGEVIRFIDENYQQELPLSVLSRQFGVSQSYIARCFKRELDTNSSDYINGVRIANACRLLVCTDMSIGRISEAVGYGNQYYFSRVFKKIRGITPMQFRKRNYTV